jgi:hypothetical protein
MDDMLEAFKASQVVTDEVLIDGGETGLEFGKFDHDHRHRRPAEPLDGFQPVPPGDEDVSRGYDWRLEQAQPVNAVNEVRDLGLRDSPARVTETDCVYR